MIALEYCQYKSDGCRHSSIPFTIKTVCQVKTRKMIRLVTKSKEPYCNDLCHIVSELPACPRNLKFLEMPIGLFPEDVRRWIDSKKKQSGKHIARTLKL